MRFTGSSQPMIREVQMSALGNVGVRRNTLETEVSAGAVEEIPRSNIRVARDAALHDEPPRFEHWAVRDDAGLMRQLTSTAESNRR
jgi:hypothetical protein